MSTSLKKVWNIFTSVIVALVLVLALLLAGGRLFGLHVFSILSGSMEPTYHTGSLIYVKEIDDTRNIPDGTVITYMTGEDTIVTHRVVTAVPDEEDPSIVRYRTKGDANEVEDGTMVHYKNIIGTPIYTIPKLGYVATFIQNPPGTYLTICFGALFILLLFLPELFGVLFAKEEEIVPEAKAEPKPRKEKKPKKEKVKKEKPVKEPKLPKEKPVKEPKLPKEKPVKEPKPRKEKPVKENKAPVSKPQPAEKPRQKAVVEAPVVIQPPVKEVPAKPEPVVERPVAVAQAPAVKARPEPEIFAEEFSLEQILAEERQSAPRPERKGRHELPPKPLTQKKKGGAHVIKK